VSRLFRKCQMKNLHSVPQLQTKTIKVVLLKKVPSSQQVIEEIEDTVKKSIPKNAPIVKRKLTTDRPSIITYKGAVNPLYAIVATTVSNLAKSCPGTDVQIF